MKKKDQLLIVILTVFLISHLVSFCSADPFVPKGAISSEPSPPLINVQLPEENQTFEEGATVWLNFSVTRPATAWNWTRGFLEQGKVVPKFGTYYRSFGEIKLIKYSLDGKSYDITGKSQYEKYGILYYYFPFEHLSAGWHRIEILAEGSGHYGELQGDIYIGSNYTANDLPSKSGSSTAEINFLIGDANATPFTTSMPLYYSILWLLPFSVLILVATILFLAYRRHRKNLVK